MLELQNILFPQQDICSVAELYYHEITSNRIDYDGYFNLFYIEKRKVYTNIDNVYLNLELEGYTSLILVHDGVDVQCFDLDEKIRKKYLFRLPFELYNVGSFWFALTYTTKANQYIKGCYTTDISNSLIHDVNIGIDICTYKREKYILNNLKKIQTQLLDKSFQVSAHIKLFVIDNGKTLKDFSELQTIKDNSHGKITIIENENFGGAGGFTRGMIEVLQRKNKEHFTHVLLMDDDAIIEPETLVRIWGLLSTLKNEWKDITIGGAMLREDIPYMLFCAGESWYDGEIHDTQKNIDLRLRKNATCNYLTQTGSEYQFYSGWWCCCYSLNTVRDDNLPLPLFIHHDDIEYGLRNKHKGIVFLNGIGVWHKCAINNFQGANIYYDVRNNLIEIALHQKHDKWKISAKYIFKTLTAAAICMKYQDVQLIYRGAMDYMKGPKCLYNQNPEKLNNDIRNAALKLYPLSELKDKVNAHDYAIIAKQIDACKDSSVESASSYKTSKTFKISRLLHYITYNGWLLPPDKSEIKLITSTDSAFLAYRKKAIVLYELGSKKICLLKRDYLELIKIFIYHINLCFVFLLCYNKVTSQYLREYTKLTTEGFWKNYLKIN